MRREPRTLDTRLLGLFPSQAASLGELPVQSVQPYTKVVSRLPKMPIQRTDILTPLQRRHAFYDSARENFLQRFWKKRMEALEEIRCTPARRNNSNARVREIHQ